MIKLSHYRITLIKHRRLNGLSVQPDEKGKREVGKMIKIAILGFGNIGSGVAQALELNQERITQAAGEGMEVKYIVDIADLSKSPYHDRVVRDFAVVEQDPEISVVVETIGGQRVAYDYTRRALLAGKNVVTSNKELVSEKGCELVQIAKENGVSYLFEASVGGGIPILQPLSQSLAANNIREIYGILNGTTNYILTRMFGENAGFEDALREAQALGYAEANPAADVDGLDACRKIAILADLAFGVNISPAQVYTEGIRGITAADTEFARDNGYVVKLLGRAVKRADGKIYVLVAPHFIENTRPISAVSGVFNGICVNGDLVGETMFYGSGAGKLPTASAVVGDLVEIARRRGSCAVGWSEGREDFVADIGEMNLAYFARVHASDAAAFARVFPEAQAFGVCGDFAGFLTSVLPESQFKERKAILAGGGVEILSLIRKL